MYKRNFSVENDLFAIEDDNVNSSTSASIVACNAGWKFQHNDPDVTTVVADVSWNNK